MKIQERLRAEVKQEKWSNLNGELLLEFVRHLNGLIDAVRTYLQPNYRQSEGYFLIHDDLGYRNGGKSIIFKPEPYPFTTQASSPCSTKSPKATKRKFCALESLALA